MTLYRKLKTHFKDEGFSFTEIMRDLSSLQAISLTIKDKQVKIRTELKDGASQIFRAIGMRPPNRILHSELGNVVIRQHT